MTAPPTQRTGPPPQRARPTSHRQEADTPERTALDLLARATAAHQSAIGRLESVEARCGHFRDGTCTWSVPPTDDLSEVAGLAYLHARATGHRVWQRATYSSLPNDPTFVVILPDGRVISP